MPDPQPKPVRHSPSPLLTRARSNRRDPTPAEALLWEWVRGKQFGYRFRRQHQLGYFILDFYCIPLRLGIEVDGDVHLEPEQASHDAARAAYLKNQDIRLLRFRNEDVLHRTDEVVAVIGRAIAKLEQLRSPVDESAAESDEEQ